MAHPPSNSLRILLDPSGDDHNPNDDLVMTEKEARKRIEDFHIEMEDPVCGALARVQEMSSMCHRFPFGQDVAEELCGRIRYALINTIHLSRVGTSVNEVQPRKVKPKTQKSSDPGYNAMNGFDCVLFARMLFEIWAKWDYKTWLIREKDVWSQLEKLGGAEISRDQWEEEIKTVSENPGPTVGDDSDETESTLHPRVHEIEKRVEVEECLHQMHHLADSFPFAQTTMYSVLGRLQANFQQSPLGSISADDFNKREKKLQERLSTILDHRKQLRTAWSQLHNMKDLIEHFRLGKDSAHRLYGRLHKALLAQDDREVFKARTDSRDMRKDDFRNVSKAYDHFSSWVKQNGFVWVANESEIWVCLHSLGVKHKHRSSGKSLDWIEDVLRCAQSASEDLPIPGEFDSDKLNEKVSTALRKLARSPGIPDDLRDRLDETAFSISLSAIFEDTGATKSSFRGTDAVSVAGEAHRLFSIWVKWTALQWVVGGFSVWSEIHRLGSIRTNWKGKKWSAKWAEEMLIVAKELPVTPDITPYERQQMASSLRRLSQRDNISNAVSTRLTAQALRWGDSLDLIPELLINRAKLEYTDAAPVSGGSGNVHFGYYKIYGKREEVAIKEFYARDPGRIKPIFSREVFTWRELTKNDSHFIVKFFGADSSASRFRLISRKMNNENIVHFLNLKTNSNQAIRCQKIYGVVSAIDWLHSRQYVHADIKGANILVDEGGNPKLGDFGISRLAFETVDAANADPGSDDIPFSTRTTIAGSIRWMAPERFDSPCVEPTKESDVYSFAYLVCEIFENRVPFPDTDDNCVFEAHLSNSILASDGDERLNYLRPASLTSDDLWNILVRCMKNDPCSRPKMEELKRDIRSFCRRLDVLNTQ
ncbi:kinase-like domain-containing protein [Mycena vulgaris]|nr:kinase-like domain-containing protein [Mycena vulgaris]